MALEPRRTAICNRDHRPGHVGRLARDEPYACFGAFLHRADATHWHHGNALLQAVADARFGVDLGVDQPRHDGVDANALSCELAGQTSIRVAVALTESLAINLLLLFVEKGIFSAADYREDSSSRRPAIFD